MSSSHEILGKCREIADKLARSMQKKELLGRTLTVKIKAATFEVKSKSHSLRTHTDSPDEVRICHLLLPLPVFLSSLHLSLSLSVSLQQ